MIDFDKIKELIDLLKELKDSGREICWDFDDCNRCMNTTHKCGEDIKEIIERIYKEM